MSCLWINGEVMHVSFIYLVLTFTIREAAYRCLVLIHQAGVMHCDFKLNNILFFAGGGVRVIDFSEAVEHDCSGPDCYELRGARDLLELPPN
jgi:serine/threonine protein kinase